MHVCRLLIPHHICVMLHLQMRRWYSQLATWAMWEISFWMWQTAYLCVVKCIRSILLNSFLGIYKRMIFSAERLVQAPRNASRHHNTRYFHHNLLGITTLLSALVGLRNTLGTPIWRSTRHSAKLHTKRIYFQKNLQQEKHTSSSWHRLPIEKKNDPQYNKTQH